MIRNYLYLVSHLFSYSSLSSTEYTILYSNRQPWGKNGGLAVGLTCVCCPKLPPGCLPLLPAPPYWGLAWETIVKADKIRHNVFMFLCTALTSKFQLMWEKTLSLYLYVVCTQGPVYMWLQVNLRFQELLQRKTMQLSTKWLYRESRVFPNF